MVVIPKFDPGSFLATIAAEHATAFPLAPTMLQMFCEQLGWGLPTCPASLRR